MSVYLDHAATTPILPEALAAFTDALGTVGNPSSIHSAGQRAKMLLEDGRAAVARSLDADPVEVVFTSGGTESINLAVKGLFWARQRDRQRPRIVVPGGEHHATVDTLTWLETHEGAVIDVVPLDAQGRVDLAGLEARLADASDVALVTFLWANNEVGTIQPVSRIVELAHAAGVPVHSDAVAAYGQVPVSFAGSGLDALSVSAHKVGGPVGIGALVLGRKATVEPLIHGGGQQRQVRSGTQDAPAAAAFGVAAGAVVAEPMPHPSLVALRDRLIAGVRAAVPSAVLMGDPVDRLPGNAHFTFPGCEGDSLLFLLDAAGVAVSTGSACQAGVPEASHVLLAMGLSEQDARGALRITLGHTTTDADVDAFLAALPDAVARAGAAGMASREPLLGR
ncbi:MULTISPECIES: cysteine desulfurase family protein [Curtobacterium]|uniref:cysteine desulfurase family protein n=1 Tax=Curtobacterium TaxID=2034 RepID=UPI0008DC98BA|nr:MULTISPECIES: cysteine desulfurase family protein [Curtobacterium]MBT1670184.1 cysteine desulfurase [Curtobacterium flaccumfaciens pv. flaccumfaciens]MCE0458671.1 cysteine desulfurase [Curtobacterium allii]OII08366.1 cysteine desulfurase NifS [Curtobacterium sp. MCBA15_005]